MPINLLIADDHGLIIDGIANLLKNEKGIGEIHTATNGKMAVDLVSRNNIDVVIMDVNMPEMNGLEATKLIKKIKPGVKLLVVSMLNDASVVSKMLRAGADGFLSKDTGKAELILAIEKIMAGENYISHNISVDLFTHFNERSTNKSDHGKHLTARELEILRLISEGMTNREIAGKLFLSTATIDTHRKNMLAKLELKNTAALIKFATDNQLL